MPTYTGTIKSVSANAGGVAFTVAWPNPSPPPPELTHTFTETPEWAWKLVCPNVGKNVVVTAFGDPETIQTVTVSA